MIPPTERVEVDGFRDAWRAAPAGLALEHGIEHLDLAGAICTAVATMPDSRMFNRVIGLGLNRAATEDDLDEAAGFFERLGVEWFVSLSPHAQPPEVRDWLEERGFAADYAWAKFTRGLDDPPATETCLAVEEVGDDLAGAFGEIVQRGYELPQWSAEWLASVAVRSDWRCYVALDGDEPAGAGAFCVSEGVGYLGFAATLPQHRRKGAQSAILARRIRDAREAGCELLVTETGDRVEGRPSNSYRNIERAGFELAYVRPNYRAPRA